MASSHTKTTHTAGREREAGVFGVASNNVEGSDTEREREREREREKEREKSIRE